MPAMAELNPLAAAMEAAVRDTEEEIKQRELDGTEVSGLDKTFSDLPISTPEVTPEEASESSGQHLSFFESFDGLDKLNNIRSDVSVSVFGGANSQQPIHKPSVDKSRMIDPLTLTDNVFHYKPEKKAEQATARRVDDEDDDDEFDYKDSAPANQNSEETTSSNMEAAQQYAAAIRGVTEMVSVGDQELAEEHAKQMAEYAASKSDEATEVAEDSSTHIESEESTPAAGISAGMEDLHKALPIIMAPEPKKEEKSEDETPEAEPHFTLESSTRDPITEGVSGTIIEEDEEEEEEEEEVGVTGVEESPSDTAETFPANGNETPVTDRAIGDVTAKISVASLQKPTEEEEMNARLKVQSEWEQIETLQREKPAENVAQAASGSIRKKTDGKGEMVRWSEANEWFAKQNMESILPRITSVKKPPKKGGWMSTLKSVLPHEVFMTVTGKKKGKRVRSPSVARERDLNFCIALMSYDDDIVMHDRVLQTIYKKLTGAKFDCPRLGSHWEAIGFQGNDPATDLRGVGMLGLLHILYGLNTYFDYFHDIYRLSKDDFQNFPFCAMSMSMTRISLEAVREGCCNKLLESQGEAATTMGEVYVAAFSMLYKIWRVHKKTIADSGFVLDEVTKMVKKSPGAAIARMQADVKERKAGASGEAAASSGGGVVSMTDLE